MRIQNIQKLEDKGRDGMDSSASSLLRTNEKASGVGSLIPRV